MFSVIYEINKITPNYGAIIVAPVFWLFLVALVRERFFLKNSEFYLATRLKFYTFFFSSLLLASLSTIMIFSNLENEKIINKLLTGTLKDKKGNLLKQDIIEGFVENFVYGKSSSKGGESFTINGVMFAYGSNQLYGYCIYANNGGVIKPGKYLRIQYVNYDSFYGKIIFKIEEDVKKTKLYPLSK